MLHVVQLLLGGFYAVLPLAMVGWVAMRRPRGRLSRLVSVIFTCVSGLAAGTALLLANGKVTGGHLVPGEGARVLYYSVAVVCTIKLVDRLLMAVAVRLGRIRLDGRGRPVRAHHARALAAILLQRLALLAFVIPYVLALLLVYRPRVQLSGSPELVNAFSPKPTRLKAPASVSFTASDGTRLVGWWISARQDVPNKASDEAVEQWGKRTVIICHGMGSAKEHQLGLAWLLANRGYNVLVFDFRGHGESDGNLVSFGDRERLDVEAAVRWLKLRRSARAERIFGIGSNTGAAALLAAAAEMEGRQFDALVLYQPYASFRRMAAIDSGQMLPAGMGWLMRHVGIPLASLHAGSDLGRFAPAEYAARIWPRPVLVVHGRGQSFVPLAEEMDLYASLLQPKDQFWPADNYAQSRARLARIRGETAMLVDMFREWLGTRDNISRDAGVQYRTLHFLRDEENVPVL